MQTTTRCYRIDRHQISYVKFIIEAYDHVAVLSTLDRHEALVLVAIAPGCEHLFEEIVTTLATELELVAVDKPASPTVGMLPAGRLPPAARP